MESTLQAGIQGAASASGLTGMEQASAGMEAATQEQVNQAAQQVFGQIFQMLLQQLQQLQE